ncbi:MAG: primosomal protein N' [Cytophagales bacterium]
MPQLLFENEFSSNDRKLFCHVLLPIPLNAKFTYVIPSHLYDQISIGSRVLVSFGAKKIYTGIVTEISSQAESNFELKYIIDVLDASPVMNKTHLEYYAQLAQYYMCTEGEVLKAGLPGGLKLSSESLLQLNPLKLDEPLPEIISPEEILIINHLREKELMPYEELPKILGKKNFIPFVRSLIQREWVITVEQVKDKFTPKILSQIYWAGPTKIDELKPVFDSLSKSPKQLDLLMDALGELRKENGYHWQLPLNKKSLSEKHSTSSLQSLIKKGLLREEKQIVKRIRYRNEVKQDLKKLNPHQERCLFEIAENFKNRNTVLLHGVTGSGKTEVYIHLIEKFIQNGHQVLYLLPEIALSGQIATRLAKHFGDNMVVYHSKFSDNERVEVWNSVMNNECQLVLGVRSALFLPFSDLALVVVDEEHEPSYKQQSPAPRYHARESAIMLAMVHSAKVLLGSATPSLESIQNAKSGMFGLVELKERHAEIPMPEIKLVSFQDRLGNDPEKPYTLTLVEEIKNSLQNGEQTLLFYNRRGYAPHIQCESCSWVPYCPSCNITLTYHQYSGKLKCHICGFSSNVPRTCKTCNSSKLLTVGSGTEKIEDELKTIFPDAKIARMDHETTRSKFGHQEIISKVENHEVDILLGTQMIAKGLDFKNMKLAVVLDAEKVMFFPDFRASERAYQLMTQIAGRAGRHGSTGSVIIQTLNPKNRLLIWVKNQDFLQFVEYELEERRKFFYPPFSRLIQITIQNKDKEITALTARHFYKLCSQTLGIERLKGPEFPIVDKIRDFYRMIILVKLEKKGIDLNKTKAFLKNSAEETLALPEYRKSYIEFDVDPH